MANIIKHKRSTSTATPTLSNGELGWTESGNVLFIGSYDGTTAIPVAGKRIPGTLTANQAIVTNSTSMIDKIMYGNSTVNSVVNSTALSLSNSTVTYSIVLPTAAQVTDGGYFQGANGTWQKPAGGGGGSPGGANTNIQFDDSGSFAGSNSFEFDKTSNTLTVQNEIITGNLTTNSDYISIGNSTINAIINSVSITLPAQGSNNISSPTSGLALFNKIKANRNFPVTIGSAGWDTPLQGHFIHNTIYQLTPAAATATTAIRLTSANTVAFTARVTSSANLYMSQTRVGQTTGTTNNTSTGWRNGTGLPFWRGNGTGLGGFYAACRFGVASKTTNGRAFVGFKDSTTVLTNGNPSSQTNVIGFSYDSGQTTWRAISANSTAANTIDTTFDCSTGNTNWYEGVIYAGPNGANVYYQLTNLTTGAIASGQYNTTNLPTTTTMLTWQFWNNNGIDSVANIMDWGSVQIEVNL